MQPLLTNLTEQFNYFPGTRYMGSKNKIIFEIWNHLRDLEFESFFDAFAGSNVVSYFMKCKGKRVITNDFLSFSYYFSKAIIENSSEKISNDDLVLLQRINDNNQFIQTTFKDIFFSAEDNSFLDRVRYNIDFIRCEYKKALALSALVRACLKKRSRGIFTFVGERYNDGREDMKRSLKSHFIESVEIFNKAVFDNIQFNQSLNKPTEKIQITTDLVYFDPPYYSPKSDNDYLRRYHFVEGLVKNWEGISIQENSKVKKFKSYPSPFSKKESAYTAFESLIEKFQKSIIVISYSSNSLPTKDELIAILKKYKSDVIVHEINHTYSFGNQNHKIGNINNRVQEYLFIGK